MLKTVVGTECPAESVAFRRFRTDQNDSLYIGCVSGSRISYDRNILYVVGIELPELLNIVDLAAVDVDCRRAFAEDFQFAVVVYHHRNAGQNIVGCTCDGERASLDIGDERIAFNCR